MSKKEKRCPRCNCLMFERVVKTGEHTGENGHGCPICFIRFPEYDDRVFTLWELCTLTEILTGEDDKFLFWTDE